MAFTALTPTEVSANKPISTTLMDKIRTNFDDHEARLLASGSSGSIGEVLNGSFETAQGGNPNWPDKWTVAQYSGGQVILDTTYTSHGKKSLKMSHTVSGGGGGYAESDYIGISSLYLPPLNFSYLCSVAALSIEVWVRYYAADGTGNPSTYLGERRIYALASGNPLTWSAAQVQNVPLVYSSARYIKYRFIGGVNGTATTGTVWFDGVGVPIRRVVYPYDNPNPVNQPAVTDTNPGRPWSNIGSTFNINIPVAMRWLVVRGATIGMITYDENGTPYVNTVSFRFYLAGTGRYSTVISSPYGSNYGAGTPPANASQWTWADMVMDLAGLTPGTYTLGFQMMISGSIWGNVWAQAPNLPGYSKTYAASGLIVADGTTLIVSDAYNNTPVW